MTRPTPPRGKRSAMGRSHDAEDQARRRKRELLVDLDLEPVALSFGDLEADLCLLKSWVDGDD
jgi:hypothetical protein